MAIDQSNKLIRLAGPQNIPAGTSTVFTGVAAHVYTVKKIKIVNPTAAAVAIKLGIGGVTDDKLITPAFAIDAGGMAEGEEFIPLNGVETLQADASATGCSITVTGLDQS